MGDGLPLIPGLILVAVLLALNAIFVAAEFAYVTVRRTQMQHLASEGNARARSVLRALRNLDFYVAAAQLGITMASVTLGALGEPVIAHLVEPPIERVVGSFAPAFAHAIAIACAFLLVTAMHIVLGEFVPKSIALQQPDRTSLWLVYPMNVFVSIFRPAIWLLNATGNGLLRLLGMSQRPIGDEPLRADDLALTLETSASAGLISRRELSLARNTLRLASLSVSDLMVPRSEIIAIDINASREAVLRTFAEHHYTRYPVYRDSIDQVVGILDAKHVVFALADSQGDWRANIRPPVVLPDTVPVEQALSDLRVADRELGILVDEFGGTAGIIGIVDIVEFLAGELPDESIDTTEVARRDPSGAITLSGLTHLVEVEDDLGITLPDVEAHTLGGMVMELLQRIPAAGDEVVVDGFVVRVETMDNNRVDVVRLIPRGDTTQPTEDVDER